MKMQTAQPKVKTENNQTYIIWGLRRYWIDDLNSATVSCVESACAEVGETDDLEMLFETIDEKVDATPGARAVYMDKRRWEDAE